MILGYDLPHLANGRTLGDVSASNMGSILQIMENSDMWMIHDDTSYRLGEGLLLVTTPSC